MEQTSYERALERYFPYVSRIGDQVEIFKSYPVRVRTQDKIAYYEVGASNISKNGAIIISQNENIKENANASAFEKLYLRPGDIILPYRSKQLHVGLYIESSHPLIPNPSLIIIRSGSIELGRYFFSCILQPFIKSYIESNIIGREGRNSRLDLGKFRLLLIPVATEIVNDALLSIDKYHHYANKVSLIHRQLDHLAALLSTEVIAGKHQSLDSMFFDSMDEHIGKLEGIISSVEASIIHSPAIDMLRSNFIDYPKK